MQKIINGRNVILALLFSVMFILLPQISKSQSKGYPELAPKERINTDVNQEQKQKVFFPDEYSGLDDNRKSEEAQFKSKEVSDAIELARQKYYQALILVQKRDNTRAIRYFEEALSKLNKLLSFPDIESNKDFSELAQSILDDYKEVARKSSLVDENSPAFAINELLNKEIEEFDDTEKITLDSIYAEYERNHPHKIKKTQNYGKLLPPPDSLIIPMDENPIVQKSIEFLVKNSSKRFFAKWLERSAKWFPMMKRIAEEEGMPREILYLSMIESGMDPNAVSSAKAVGLWQFMRPTGLDYELNAKGSIFVDERRDPEKSTRAAMRHLRDLYQEFGDWHLALAAYNCGAGCVSRAIKRTKSDTINYWTVRERLPDETRGYVPRYISTAKISMDPESYGYVVDSLKFHDEYLYDIFTLNEPTNLEAIAKSAGVTVDVIKDLNPELLFNCTPPDIVPYNIKLPKGSLDIFAVNFIQLTPDEKSAFLTHVVNNKETLNSVAKKYNINPDELARMNNLEYNSKRLKKGQELRVPVVALAQDNLASNNSESDNSQNKTLVNTDKFSKHKIKDGETLFSIARDYGMEVARLRKINDIDRGDKIVVGNSLYVEGELVLNNNNSRSENITSTKKKKNDDSESIILHKVRRGESLEKISNKYGVSIAEIKDWNGLRRDKINIGDVLTIRTEEEPQIASKSKGKKNDNQQVIHKVASGESLGSISKKYGVSENDLKEWNEDVINGNTIFAGTRLKIYDSGTKTASNLTKEKPKFYKVKRGDTLAEIAKKFGVSTKSLKKNNKNISERNLQAGANIRIR